jgi:plastocyanin
MITRYALASLFSIAFFATAGAAQAQESHKATIVIRNHRFEPAELKVPANKPIALTVKNEDASSEEFESKEFKAEKVIAGKSQATIRISPLKPGRYKFFGEFHESTAKGVLVAE